MPLYQLGPFKLPDPNDPKWSNLTTIGDTERTQFDLSKGNVTVSIQGCDPRIEVNGIDLFSCGVYMSTKDYEKYAMEVYSVVDNRERKSRLDYVQDKLKGLKE